MNHPIAVAKTISLLDDATEQMIAAALLHDVLEDTDVSPGEMEQKMGPTITELVMELTKRAEARFPLMNRAGRKEYECARLSFVSPEAQTIKVADLMDNTKTIVPHDPKFAATYLMEKEKLLHHALLDANPLLLHLAREQLDAAYTTLEVLLYDHATRN